MGEVCETMSKLRDRMRDVSRRRPATFGFAPTRAAADAKPRQLLVLAEAATPAEVTAAHTAGADAIVYTGPLTALTEAKAAAATTILGVRIHAATPEDTKTITEAGADFLVYADDQTHAAALLEQKLGYLTIAPTPHDDATLRLFRALDVDAVLINRDTPTAAMTVRDQLQLARIAGLARKPLFVTVQTAPTPQTLELWRDTGIAAIIGPAALAPALIEAANAVPAPRQPRDHSEALAPAPPRSTQLDDDDDDDDEH